jgi:hypothetical protein
VLSIWMEEAAKFLAGGALANLEMRNVEEAVR